VRAFKGAGDSGSFYFRFRWVFCQLQTLQHCLPQNIPHALSELPTSLDETYERVLKEIVTANQQHAYRLLQCLTVAGRSLRVEELAEILALDFDGAKAGIPELKEDWRWKDQQEAVLSTCSSLIAVVDNGRHRVVQFSHFSVKEFLISDRLATSSISHFHIPPEPAHTVIVKACLGILLQLNNEVGDAKAKCSSPLANYAAQYWVDHAQFEKVSRSVEDGMRRLFDSARPHFAAWLKLHDHDTRWYGFVGYHDNIRGSPLYYASLCGFRDLAAYLIDGLSEHVNVQVGQNLSPLGAALRNKHLHTAELLHQRGANVGVRGNIHRTLLHAASVDGSVDIAEWLLARGGDANSRDDNRDTPLHLAVKNGQIEFVRMLLGHSITVDARNKDKYTSLHLASEGGHFKIARLLLQHGANVGLQGLRCQTPLHLASSWVSAVSKPHSYYSEHRADAKGQNNSSGYSALQEGEPKAETVLVLLENGAVVTALDDADSTPLHLASLKGTFKIAQLLIQHGADVTARDDTHSTPLHLALSKGTPDLVRLMIEHGADVNARDGNHSTPLLLALLLIGGDETIRLLIEHGADVNARDRSHNMPLHLALSRKSFEIALLLIKHGAEVGAQDGSHKTPLHVVLSWVSVRAARFLLLPRADVTKK
jgi:ankyrin repeat protein